MMPSGMLVKDLFSKKVGEVENSFYAIVTDF